jgi:hypothetical protein
MSGMKPPSCNAARQNDWAGAPGDHQGYFDFPGTGQMFSSARDLAILLAAELGELSIEPLLRAAMAMTQHGLFAISPHNTAASG